MIYLTVIDRQSASQRVFVFDEGVFVFDEGVFVFDQGVLGLRSSFLGSLFSKHPQDATESEDTKIRRRD